MSAPGFTPAIGTYEDALETVGTFSRPIGPSVAVSRALIEAFCSAIEDENPKYWDDDYAARAWGGLTAPHGMLFAWVLSLPWTPGEPRSDRLLALDVPLPGPTMINVSTRTEFERPVHEGDTISLVEEVLSISPEKRTRLGVGHFLETMLTFTNQRGEVVARKTNSIFRFKEDTGGDVGNVA